MMQEGEQVLGRNEEATTSSGEAETNPEIHPENASGTACAYPTAISDYNHLAEANRQYLVGFLTRERSTQLLTNASNASIPLAGDNTHGASSTKDWTRPDNFLLDIHINEPGPALSTHNLVYSAIEKARSHEGIGSAPEETVARFQIYAPPVAEESRHGSNQHEKDEPNERGVEKGSVEDLMTLPSSDSTDRPPVPATRWIIPARSKVDLLVQFSSSDVGIFDCNLGFEIAGVCREFTLFCRGVCTVPTINSDPRNVFMSRIKSHPEHVFMQEKFVLSKNQFEFGPLIALPVAARKVPETESECAQLLKTSANSVEVFRMSNSSLFPLRVGFTLEKTDSDPAFAMYPSFLDIPEGETGEVKLRASPTRDGLQENTTVCCVSDNPEPILFSVSCFGCTPALQLRGPWEQPAANSTSESDASPRDSSSAKPILDFEQLLLKRQEEKTFFIENVSPLAVSWSLLCGDLPPDFRVFPMEGTIKSLQKASVLVVFTANTKAVYKLSIQIQFSDAESALKISDRNRVVPLVIAAEVYKIEVSSFEKESAATAGIGNTSSGSATTANGDGSLDFGLVRVGESHSRSFTIRNRGKYNIKYVLSIRTHASRELFKVEPSELILEPDKVSSVNVAFFSKREVTLRDCKDIKCTIIEMISGEPCREFTVSTTVRSVFSVFRIQPNRGINFGPHKYNDLAKSKRMEVRNDGEFPFKFRIRPPTKSAAASGSPDDDSLSLGTLLNLAVLNIGQFSVSPDCGSVDPGVTVGVDVTFQPIDCKVYREFIHIEISGRNMLGPVGADSLQYELAGESCFPGITTNDFESIFEGQIVVRSLGLDCATAPAQQQRQPSSSSSNALGFSMLGIQSVVFAEKEQTFSFGALTAAANSKGTVERFKITNPTKVTTTVQFQVSNSSHGSGFVSEVAPVQAFTVQPSVWEIPPLEHRFVSVYFKPTTIASYQAVFKAKVDESPPQATAQSLTNDALLHFELRGEGTIPCVSIMEPTQRDASEALVLNFGRVRVSKSKDLSIILRNDGILSSTKMHDEATTSLLKITVHSNPFDETTVKLTGTGCKEDLVFEDLPLGHDDELHFDDIQLLSEHHHNSRQDGNAAARATDVKVFSLCNQTSDTVRFAWPKTMPPFSFTPAVGHLRPKSYKLITGTFSPDSLDTKHAVIYHAHPIALQAQRIAYKDPVAVQSSSPSDWDGNARTVAFEGSQPGVSGADETLAEPAFETIGAPAVITLSCFAAADALSHRISIHNKSKIKLVYSWRFERAFGADAGGFLPNVSASSGSVDDDCPFEISPEAGTIAAEVNQVFAVKFAPMEVDDYHYTLVLEAESTHDDNDAFRTLRIDVRGASLRPTCHFDVERSDYAQRGAPHVVGPNGELGPLDHSVKVIEMESLGVRVRNTRRFYVVNPTNVSYEFTWTPEAEVNPCFRCATPKGLMLAGKRCEMIFEFMPQQLELQEMFWRFQIPHFQVNQLFLFVGTTTEPRVILDRGSVNFNTLLIGTKASQSIALVNYEHIPFNFVFDKSSLDFANEMPALLVHPLSGVIPPNSRCNIDIEFVPTEEKTYNFNLNCIVKRKPTRLSLNVKGEGYSIHDALTIASDDQNETRSVVLGVGNLVDFGAVRVNEELQRCAMIHNMGKFNFEFNWSAQKFPVGFSIEPMQGTVKKTDKVTCKLLFAPSKQTFLDGTQVACTIAGSRHYVFALHGNAVSPSLQFSFMAHDFGPCFVAEPDALPILETVQLNIFNMDPEIGIDLDCLFEKKPHLRVECPPTVLGPRESVNIPIVFTARQEMSYIEMVPFTINGGSSTINISIRGEGITPKVEPANPAAMQSVAFSALQIGQQLSRTIKIVNRAKRKITVGVVDGDSVPGVLSLEALSISILSPREIVLRPKETADIEFKFAPIKRTPAFQKDVFLNIAGSKKKLVTLSGCCQGMEVALDTDTLSFGTVCLGSQHVCKVRLQNRGDVAAKFQWNPRAFAPDFTVSPTEGMVAPNYHKTLETTFKPAAVNPDLRYDHLACVLEGVSPVFLTLAGGCIKQATSSIHDIHFKSRVRESATKQIVIENTSTSPWNLFPVVTGEHWSCQENVTIPAEGKATVDVVYCPLRMTKKRSSETEVDDSTHHHPEKLEGSIFFAIPDGTALLYNVFGKATAPASAGTINVSTPAKKTLPIAVPMKNWLKIAQTFDVAVSKPNGSESVRAQGPSSITVQGYATRNYNLKFFSYTEGVTALALRFMNPENGEYVVYDVNVTVTQATEIETVQFEAPVRQSLKKTIAIENPFDATRVVAFADPENWWRCSNPAIRVRQLAEITGRPEGLYEVECRPTLHLNTPVEVSLTISFAELGEYTYKLVLATQPAGVERILRFKAPLGGSQTQSFAFTTFSDKPTDVACSVQQPTFFSVPNALKIDGTMDWEGKNHVVQIKFEPEALGEIRDTLTLFADTVGEYK
ncbi:hypothetical protein FI667_g5469, partial [Globisporangium splendens]